MSSLWKYGGYTYTDRNIITGQPREMSIKQRVADTPGNAGQYTQGGLLNTRPISLRGHLIPNDGEDLRTLWKALTGAHMPGLPQKLYLGYDDEFVWAEVTGCKDTGTYGSGDDFPTSIPWEINFAACDPFTYADTASTASINSGGTVTTGGAATSVPVFTIVLSALGTAGTLTLTNTTTGQSFTLAMPGSLTTLTVDCDAQKVTNTGGTDVTDLFLSGDFWELAAGANVVTKATSGGAATSAITVTWRDRWPL